ncbi:alginate lyase family protein [Kiritimatiellaeota bacterium B1221]|nr:alginate lyase family protein [Kiritimatiellaeota bacterium B1221]
MSRFSMVLRLFQTLRYLKPVQLRTQVIRRIQAKCPFHLPEAKAWTWSNPSRPELRFQEPSGASACLNFPTGKFSFVGVEEVLGSPIDWSGKGAQRLWAYNLHYFEWIWGLNPDDAKDACEQWIRHHSGSASAVGWEPYPLSLRIQNWCAYWQTKGSDLLQQDEGFQKRLAVSLGLQATWLTKRLEYHILANHLLENAAALFVAGHFLQGEGIERMRSLGWKIVKAQLQEQVLADGMHFERSPMYHFRVTYLVDMMKAWAGEGEDAALEAYAVKLGEAGTQLLHPDGEIALFNDSAFGIYPPGKRMALSGSFALPTAGYYGSRSKNGHYIICDAGALGPDYQPGHAHCDLLSFEWSFFGKRLISDTGTSTYLPGPSRLYERSTAAHNTWAPEGGEQGEIWSAFRLGRRPEVQVHSWEPTANGGFILEACHTGFDRKAFGHAMHTRTFRYDPEGSLRIEDRFSGSKTLSWEGHFHFDPDVEIYEISSGSFRMLCGGKELRFSVAGAMDIRIEESPFSPQFHQQLSRPCLVLTCSTAQSSVMVEFTW